MSDIYSISSMRLEDATNGLISALHRGDTIAALRHVSATADRLGAISAALVEAGVREGLTQAAMARALSVPASTLRGVRREHGRV